MEKWTDRVRIEVYRYPCWKCGGSVPIALNLGLVRGRPYGSIWGEEVGELPSGSAGSKALTEAIHARHPPFYWDYSRTKKGSYGMNHCRSCGTKFGDAFITEWCRGVAVDAQAGGDPPKPEASWEVPWAPEKVRERYVEREPVQWGDVHHLDGNPGNNDPANLRLVCVQCHASRHGRRPKREAGGAVPDTR